METRTRSLCAERWGRRIPTECLHAQAARTETRRNKAQDAGDSTQLSRFPVSFVCAVSGMPGGTRARPPPAPRCPRPHQLLRIRCAGTRMRRVHIASAVSNFRCITVKSCCWPRVGARLACPGPSVPERYGESCMPRQLQPVLNFAPHAHGPLWSGALSFFSAENVRYTEISAKIAFLWFQRVCNMRSAARTRRLPSERNAFLRSS